jgi:hypothetical protein
MPKSKKVSQTAMDEYIVKNPSTFTPKHRGEALVRTTQKEMNQQSGSSGHGGSTSRPVLQRRKEVEKKFGG